ncbi:MAG: TRAP transporter small permease subunit [Chloroflexota bacterium]
MLSKIGKWYSEVFLYKASRQLLVIGRITVVLMMLANVVTVAVRKLIPSLASQFVGGYEFTQVAMGFVAVFAGAYTWYTAGHIRVGILRDSLKERPKAFLDAVSAFLGMIFAAVVVWAVFLAGQSQLATGYGTTMRRIPFAPFSFIYGIVMAHVFLVLLRSFIGLVSKAVGKKFAHETYLENQ